MTEARSAANAPDTAAWLRQLGARAHQLRASLRAADQFNGNDDERDRDTAAWLVSGALSLAEDLTTEFDGLARAGKDKSTEPALQARLAALRVRAHQLLAAARAADRFLERDSREDRETGGWLVATAFGLADKLAAETDDAVLPARKGAEKIDKAAIEPHDPTFMRRLAQATAP